MLTARSRLRCARSSILAALASTAGCAAQGDASAADASADASVVHTLDDAGASHDAGLADAAGPSDASAATDGALATTDAAMPVRSCKRGVAYNHEAAADAPLFGKGIGWWYDWGSAPSTGISDAFASAGAEYVPMVWSAAPTRTVDVQALIKSIPSAARYLLAFNEPNFGAQAHLTPAQAAAAWPMLEQVAQARGLKLVSPAVNYCGGDCNQTDPFAWLDAFFAACTGCQVDYVAFHWYACSIDALKSIVGKYESKYKKPVWLTEFACLDDPGDHSETGQRKYMDQAVAFLESDPLVFRYAWFIGRSSTPAAIDLFGAPASFTSLGQAYAAYPASCE